jgi:hypothetical protein
MAPGAPGTQGPGANCPYARNEYCRLYRLDVGRQHQDRPKKDFRLIKKCKWWQPLDIRLLEMVAAGALLVSWWDWGRSSLGIYLALVVLAVLELARKIWLLTGI